MTKKSITKYKIGLEIKVHDKMQKNYSYTLTENPGKNFRDDFKPELTPQQMLKMGVFEGKYINDCENEFPKEWYESANEKKKLSPEPNILVNQFKIKSRMSLQEWKNRGWIPLMRGDKDVRGWFQWYCRYWLGRRMTDIDNRQIGRWKGFKRHKGQILASLRRMNKKDRPTTKSQIRKHRPKQRQALLQWAYNPYVKI